MHHRRCSSSDFFQFCANPLVFIFINLIFLIQKEPCCKNCRNWNKRNAKPEHKKLSAGCLCNKHICLFQNFCRTNFTCARASSAIAWPSLPRSSLSQLLAMQLAVGKQVATRLLFRSAYSSASCLRCCMEISSSTSISQQLRYR